MVLLSKFLTAIEPVNAGEMIRKQTLIHDRTRQAIITRELIEIISVAEAL